MTLDDLEEELRKLSDADFTRLARRLGFDAPTLQWAEVEIDDDKETPIAIVEYADGSQQKIDIFAAIRANTMTIANPIILIAIRHWYRILQHRSALTFKDDWDNREDLNGEPIRFIREWMYASRPKKAAKNLTKISKIIIDTAKERSFSREAALVARVQHEGYDQKNTLLYEAFEWLRKDKTRSKGQRLSNLEEALRKARVSNSRISIERVMGFLKSAKGENYIRPRNWEPMLNGFIAWRFGISQDSVVKYRSTARTNKNEIDNEIDTRFFFPRYNKYNLSPLGEMLLRHSLILPAEAYLKNDEEDVDLV